MEIQGWSVQRALKDLDITEVPFDPELLETTEHGYIQNREIAVNHSEHAGAARGRWATAPVAPPRLPARDRPRRAWAHHR